MTGSAATHLETATAVDELLHAVLTDDTDDRLLADEQSLERVLIGLRITARAQAFLTQALVEPTRQRLHNSNRWVVRIPRRHLRHRLRTSPLGSGDDDH